MKVVELSDVLSGCHYPLGYVLISVTVVVDRSDTIGNRPRHLSACSIVPKPTAPPLPYLIGVICIVFLVLRCCSFNMLNTEFNLHFKVFKD
jgi:hypothetical protein